MTNLCRLRQLLIVPIFLLTHSSCGQIIKQSEPLVPAEASAQSKQAPEASVQTPVQTKQPSPSSIQAPTQTKQPSQSSIQAPVLAKQHMESGDYQKAIDAYRTEYLKHPKDQSLVKVYVKNIEDIKEIADLAFNVADYLSAGKIYNILVRYYQDFNGFSKLLSFERSYLISKLANCKAYLSENGFREYRKGNLKEAIELWKGYLAIDPKNATIRKALNTATLQQKNLEQMK